MSRRRPCLTAVSLRDTGDCAGPLLQWTQCLILFSLLLPSAAPAQWTGVSAGLANVESDWSFDSGRREADISELSFQIEEETQTGLVVGLDLGFMDMRLIPSSASSADSLKFDGQYIGIYLRQPLRINERLSLHGMLRLSYHSGDKSGDDADEDDAEIDWTSSLLELGMSLRLSSFRVTPYAVYNDIDGDVSGGGTEVFDVEDNLSQGVRFDYFVEDSAFIQFDFITGGSAGGYLNFVRRY